jgi:hypothetical protein
VAFKGKLTLMIYDCVMLFNELDVLELHTGSLSAAEPQPNAGIADIAGI